MTEAPSYPWPRHLSKDISFCSINLTTSSSKPSADWFSSCTKLKKDSIISSWFRCGLYKTYLKIIDDWSIFEMYFTLLSSFSRWFFKIGSYLERRSYNKDWQGHVVVVTKKNTERFYVYPLVTLATVAPLSRSRFGWASTKILFAQWRCVRR